MNMTDGKKKSQQKAIDEMTLALLYLNSFPDGTGSLFDEISWKNYDFATIDRLDEQEMIINPKRRSGGGYKYAYMTEKGRLKAREILKEYGIVDKPLYERFEFRNIRPEEVEEAAEIESTCFPPNEACTKEHLIERAKAAPDLFLVAIERETGKMAGFLNGIATDASAFQDEFFIFMDLKVGIEKSHSVV